MPLGVGRGQNVGLRDFWPYLDFVAAGGIRVSQTHVLFFIVLYSGEIPISTCYALSLKSPGATSVKVVCRYLIHKYVMFYIMCILAALIFYESFCT